MKKLLCLLVLWGAACQLPAQVTGNVISRVFQIRLNGLTGTAFAIDYGNWTYFITANHMVAKSGDEATVDIFSAKDSVWRSLKFTILHGKSPCVDVAILVPGEPGLTGADPIPYDYVFAMGQEAYFLGFPFGLFGSFKGQTVAYPLIKHGYISAAVPCSAIYPEGAPDENLILLDGINNHGFSGGPVVAPDVFNGTRALKLIGIISAYKYEDMPINVNGLAAPNATGSANSGIIVVIPISQAIDLIKTYATKRDATKPH